MTEDEHDGASAPTSGWCSRKGALFDSLTVRENVGYKLFEELNWPLDEANARVEEVLGFIGLGEFIDRMPSELSGGQRRRVAIARAMAAKPRILLYDEPTTGLDPITAMTVDEEIIKLRDLEGVSSILVTHQLRDAFFVAEHTARPAAAASWRSRRPSAAEGRRGGVHHAARRQDRVRRQCRRAARRRGTRPVHRCVSFVRTDCMPRTRSLAWSELKIGIVAVVAIGLAVMLIIAVGGQGGFSWEQYELKTKFPDVKGLKSGAVVRVAGVEVGKVDEVKLVGSEVEVRLEGERGEQAAHHRAVARVDRLAEPARRAGHRHPPVDPGHAAQGRRLPPAGRAPGQLADVAEGATQALEQVTGDPEGHPQRQGHRRQAVHRRPDLPGGQRPHRLGRASSPTSWRAARARSAC